MYPIKVSSPLFLAPMAGVTNVAYRILCKEMGAGICYTEFLSADALITYKDVSENPVFDVVAEERPVVTQIFGEDPEKIFEAAQSLQGKTDIIDFNVGCPAPKILACGGGSALLRDPEKIRMILRRLNTLDTPISCKIRLGIDEEHIVALEVAKIAEDEGCCAIAVHPRTQKQGYSGHADWSYIKKIKEIVSIPVIGNGDIQKPEDVKRMMDETGCDYVMIGRAAMKDPFFFKKTLHYLQTGEVLPDVSFEEKMQLLKRYIFLLQKYDVYDANLIKQVFIRFSKGYRGSSVLRAELSQIHDADALLAKIENFSR
ncbi:tRNA dihydrouridine synthase DusB [Candidatus Woesearchaeota archaeon]|nr:tRNA dihydrouridine synthase DusB [Candidatus Woesearchaeota archaeon]